MVLEQAVRVFTEAAIGGPSRRLHVGDAPMPRPKHAEKGLRMQRPGPHLDVERLMQQTAVRGPEA
jgi:hypothetical protein